MFILWGFRGKLLKPRYMGIRYCRRCGQFRHFYLMRLVQQFTLFFIPVFWWTKAYYLGCESCESARKLEKEEYLKLNQQYENFPDREKCTEIFEFCFALAKNRENTPENVEKLFQLLKERFDLRGFDEDFKKMIMNILAVEEAARFAPHIVD